MARPNKIGLDYFSFDADFFNDPKIKLLMAKYKRGVEVYLKILTWGYKEHGYFLPADEDTLLILSGELNITEELITEIIEFMTIKNLFSDTLYSKYKILTCKRMQLNYLSGTEKRTKITFQFEYLLIDPNQEKSKMHKSEIEIISFGIPETELKLSETELKNINNTQSETETEIEIEIEIESESKKETEIKPNSFSNKIFLEKIKNLFSQYTKYSDPNLKTFVYPIYPFFEKIPEHMTENDVEKCVVEVFKSLQKNTGIKIDFLVENIHKKIIAEHEKISSKKKIELNGGKEIPRTTNKQSDEEIFVENRRNTILAEIERCKEKISPTALIKINEFMKNEKFTQAELELLSAIDPVEQKQHVGSGNKLKDKFNWS